MLEDGEGEESSRQHFHLPAIMKEERDSNKKKKQRLRRQGRKGKRDRATGEEEEEERDTAPSGTRDGFQIDLTDPRFSALYESHLYAPNPANPSYK